VLNSFLNTMRHSDPGKYPCFTVAKKSDAAQSLTSVNPFEFSDLKFKTINERILVGYESSRLEVTSGYIANKVSVCPGIRKSIEVSEILVVPTTYKTVTEQFEVQKSYPKWRNIADLGMYCLGEVPARYSTITKKVVHELEITRERFKKIDLCFDKNDDPIEKWVPDSLRKIVIPAEFQTVIRSGLDLEALKNELGKTEIGQADVSFPLKNTKPMTGNLQLREVYGDANLSPAGIILIKTALKNAKFFNDNVNANLDLAFFEARKKFQFEKNLPVDHLITAINIETVRALGVNLKD
jgi:hypothetical protein